MIRISQIKVEVTLNQEENIQKALQKKLRTNPIDNYKIIKRSIDARDKNKIFYVYEIDVNIPYELEFLKNNKDRNISLSTFNLYSFKPQNVNKNIRPIIVGFGPAGLFTAYILILNGIKPIIIDRGCDVDTRVKDIEEFWQTNNLKPNSNIQFGEGGAGTFSDGKLNTSSKDKEGRNRFVLESLVKFGANPDILINNTPHVGTDILRKVVKNMRKYLISEGATVRFNTLLTNINIKDNKITSIEVNKEEIIPTDHLILAIGHSARDTFRMLSNYLNMEAKPFAVGMRIMHPVSLINESQYGTKYKDLLGAANYKLTYQSSNNHGVYSFCMCPGGYVVNASSEPKRLAINGMSNYLRDSNISNSAIVVTVNESTFGKNLFSGLEFQEKLEEKAYILGHGLIPIQLLKDYYQNIPSTKLGSITPEIKGKYNLTNLNDLLPKELNNALKEGIKNFGTKIKDFDHPDAILAGIESRTSSPLKILRDENYHSNIKGIYPCGEGAGYAGGIMTSAIDGMKVAEALILSECLRDDMPTNSK